MITITPNTRFLLHVKFKIVNGKDAFKLDEYLNAEGIIFDCERHDCFYHYHIICDDLVDGAKVETCLSQLKSE